MDEKSLRAVLAVIPTMLLVICVVAAFAVQGWDTQATLFAESPEETLERIIPFDLKGGAEESLFEVTGYERSEDGSTFTLGVLLHSPLNVSMKVEKLSAGVLVGNSTGTLNLPNVVEIPPRGSKNVTLEGSLPEKEAQMPFSFVLSNMTMGLNVSGIVLELSDSGLGGAVW